MISLPLEIVIFEFIPVLAGAIALVFGFNTYFNMKSVGKKKIQARLFLNYKLFQEVLFFAFAAVVLLFLNSIGNVSEILIGKWLPITAVIETIYWIFTAYAVIQFNHIINGKHK